MGRGVPHLPEFRAEVRETCVEGASAAASGTPCRGFESGASAPKDSKNPEMRTNEFLATRIGGFVYRNLNAGKKSTTFFLILSKDTIS
jgi:hypothetical protein